MKKAFGKIKIVLNVLLTIFVILFLLMVCLQRFTNNEISFLNYRMFTVASGSMAPEYEVGDVLIARETKEEDIKVGDSVSYLGDKGSFAGKVVTHEVIRIEKDVDGNYIFHTKGKANLVEDPPITYNQIYGVIVWNPKLLSFIYKVINTKYGLFIFVILPIFYIIGSEMLTAMLEREEERRAQLKANKKEEKEEQKEEPKKEEPKKKPTKKSTTSKSTTTKKTTSTKKSTTKKTTKKETK